MRKKYLYIIVAALMILSGCAKSNDKADESKEQTSQNISEKREEESTKEPQESEYSAEEADAILEEMGIKSYDIWTYLRPDTGEETDSFLNAEYEKAVLEVENEGVEFAQEKEEFIEERRQVIHGRYKIEQQEPLIIKVNCKNDNNTAYLSEKQWHEKAYAYISPNGYLFKDNNKWYEIQGYNDYKEINWIKLSDYMWKYSGNAENGEFYILDNYLYGYDKRDENIYNEEKIKDNIKGYIEPEIPEGVEYVYRDGECAYNCEDFTINAYYRIEVGSKQNFVKIGFYTMLDEYKALTCYFSVVDSKGYYNEITEEMLRDIFTVREYK